MDKRKLRILICGGRNYDNVKKFNEVLELISIDFEISCVISGAARGADSLAIFYSEMYNIPCEKYPADWNSYGKAAGMIRNKQMLSEGCPDCVIAFPGGRGTKNMIDLTKKAGIPILIITE